MAVTAKDIIKRIKEENIQMVDFKMVDINGQFRHVTIPAQHFTESTMTEGIGFDDYMTHKTEAACRATGTLRVEGKDYTVRDGDVMHFLFNV